MSTLILNGSGSALRVTSKSNKPANVFMVTRKGVKRINVTDKVNVKFAA